MRVGVYVDGFNLFYGLKRFESFGQNYRWLDLGALAQRIRPHDEICRIRYFTARVDARDDVLSPRRQEVYIRALRTVENLSIHEGEFRTDKRMMPLVNPPDRENLVVNVWRTEEKGSDVSLASYLLVDGFRNDYDLAILITNDSDLMEPIKLAQEELGYEIGVHNPQARFSGRLRRVATFYRQINEADFAASQFPDTIIDQNGRRITRPAKWNDSNV
jgi:hypothetical protein